MYKMIEDNEGYMKGTNNILKDLGDKPVYLDLKSISKLADEADGGDAKIEITRSVFRLTDCFDNVILQKSFSKYNTRHIVTRVPFGYFDEYDIDPDDEDYELSFQEYLDDTTIPYCVFIDGHIITLKV